MSHQNIAYSEARHPAQHRQRVSLIALFFGLFAGPITWSGNEMVTYGLAVHACYPDAWPQDTVTAGFGFAWPLILGLYLASLCICAAAFAISYRNWAVTGSESEGHAHHLIEVGEGRTRYLSIIGMAFSVLFFCATMYGAIVMATVPLCVH